MNASYQKVGLWSYTVRLAKLWELQWRCGIAWGLVRQGGEIGWVACVPEHRGKRLGFIVSAATTARLMEEGCRHIHLYTEDWWFAALKTYLRLGYIPYNYKLGAILQSEALL